MAVAQSVTKRQRCLIADQYLQVVCVLVSGPAAAHAGEPPAHRTEPQTAWSSDRTLTGSDADEPSLKGAGAGTRGGVGFKAGPDAKLRAGPENGYAPRDKAVSLCRLDDDSQTARLAKASNKELYLSTIYDKYRSYLS